MQKYILRSLFLFGIPLLFTFFIVIYFLKVGFYVRSITDINNVGPCISKEIHENNILSQLTKFPANLIKYKVIITNNLRVQVAISDHPESLKFDIVNPEYFNTILECSVNSKIISIDFGEKKILADGLNSSEIEALFKSDNCKASVNPYIPEHYKDCPACYVFVYDGGFHITIKPNYISISFLYFFVVTVFIGLLKIFKEILTFLNKGRKYFLL